MYYTCSKPIPLEDLLHMLPTNETLESTRRVIDEQLDKRMDEIEKEKYWDWQPTDDESGKFKLYIFLCVPNIIHCKKRSFQFCTIFM